MRKRLAAAALAVVLVGCGGNDDGTPDQPGDETSTAPTTAAVNMPTESTTTTAAEPTTTTAASPYDTYVALAGQLGGEVIARADAATRAALLCSDPASASQAYFGGIPLSEFPTDLALVRAYCPGAEADF